MTRFLVTLLAAFLAAFLARLVLDLFLFGHALDARGLWEEILAALVGSLLVTLVVMARQRRRG